MSKLTAAQFRELGQVALHCAPMYAGEVRDALNYAAELVEDAERMRRLVLSAHCQAYGELMEGKFIRSAYHMIPSKEWRAIDDAARGAV